MFYKFYYPYINKMKKDTIGLIIKIIIAVLTGLASALGLASCMSAAGMTGFMHTL